MNNNQGRRRTRRVRQQRKQSKAQISRILLTICMMALVAVISIGGTLAWLTDTTSPVVNTFTESDVDIELTETDSDNDEDEQKNSYKMVPGNTITKDPKVTVKADSEECFVFVKLVKENGFDNFLTFTMADGWNALPTVDGVYYRTVEDTNVDQYFAVIKDNQVTVKTDVTKAMMEGLTANTYPKLTVTAYAIQTANIEASGNKTVEQVAWETLNPSNP